MATPQVTHHRVFHEVATRNGETRFRTNFGRQKSLSFRRHDETGYFYLDVYHNKRGGTFDHICFGTNDMQTLIELFGHLESLKPCFPKESTN